MSDTPMIHQWWALKYWESAAEKVWEKTSYESSWRTNKKLTSRRVLYSAFQSFIPLTSQYCRNTHSSLLTEDRFTSHRFVNWEEVWVEKRKNSWWGENYSKALLEGSSPVFCAERRHWISKNAHTSWKQPIDLEGIQATVWLAESRDHGRLDPGGGGCTASARGEIWTIFISKTRKQFHCSSDLSATLKGQRAARTCQGRYRNGGAEECQLDWLMMPANLKCLQISVKLAGSADGGNRELQFPRCIHDPCSHPEKVCYRSTAQCPHLFINCIFNF